MKKSIYIFIVLLILSVSIAFGAGAVKIFDTTGRPRGISMSEGGRPIIEVEYANEIPADYYLYKAIAIPVLSATTAVDDKVVNVISSTGVAVGHAITFYEGNNMFQALVTGTAATTITLSSPLDFEYTSAALIEAGIWNMNVDGSSTEQIFLIKAPPTSAVDVHTINCSMLDATEMDDGTFGGMAALTNGILFRYVGVASKNLAVIVNNIGFWEIGFHTEYALKAPAGQYGFRTRRSVTATNGVTLHLNSGGLTSFRIYIRDDLTDLDLFACTVDGHMLND